MSLSPSKFGHDSSANVKQQTFETGKSVLFSTGVNAKFLL